MREILFKAKRMDNGEWVEGYYYESKISGCYILTPKLKVRKKDGIIIGDSFDVYEVDPETLCQYTGLTDKNDKKIWENDILELPGEDGYFTCEWEEDTARFVMNGDGLTVDFDNYWGYQTEVVGNIFDNADLLEVE